MPHNFFIISIFETEVITGLARAAGIRVSWGVKEANIGWIIKYDNILILLLSPSQNYLFMWCFFYVFHIGTFTHNGLFFYSLTQAWLERFWPLHTSWFKLHETGVIVLVRVQKLAIIIQSLNDWVPKWENWRNTTFGNL